jgi:uncharacterized protein (DUF2336 family)
MKTLLVGLIGAALFAQDAVVVKIPDAEAASLKVKYEALKKALKEFEDAKFDAEKAATEKMAERPLCASWEFTPDFKLAVPKQCSFDEIVEKLSKDSEGGKFMQAPRSEKI